MCMGWRHAGELLAAGNQIYESLLNLCIWVKSNAGIGSFYRSRHELIFVFKSGKGPHRNNVQLGRYGRNRTNVWEYPSVSALSRQGDEGNLLALHPTVKPVALVADALLDCSARGDIVLDSFSWFRQHPNCGRTGRPNLFWNRNRTTLRRCGDPSMATAYRRPRHPCS